MKKGKNIKRIVVLGAAGLALVTGLTGCSKAMKEAQANIDDKVVTVMNADDEVMARLGGEISNFTFLSADTTKENNNQYTVDINGIATTKATDEKAYTTLNYLIDGKYFDSMEKATHENIINTLASVVENEKFNSISVNKVKDVKALNEAMGLVSESPVEDYRINENFLYGIGNVEFNDKENVVSFTAKETTKFGKTTTDVSWGVTGIGSDGGLEFGWVVSTKTDYKTFFIDQKVYVKLSKEDFEKAKTDESVIFEKFVGYVNNNQKDNYVIKTESVLNSKDFSANMMNNVSLQKA